MRPGPHPQGHMGHPIQPGYPMAFIPPPPSQSNYVGPASVSRPAPGASKETIERAVRHTYDAEKDEWTKESVLVILEMKPFQQGCMRTAHHMWEVEEDGCRCAFVAKFTKTKVSADSIFEDAKLSMISQLYADKFNRVSGVDKKVAFLPSYVLKLLDRGDALCCSEPVLLGQYEKHNNNDGAVATARMLPQAFSHFTWEQSGRKLLICDIQGVGDYYTDPQILSSDGVGYGQGNCGMDAIVKFLRTHQCSDVCRYMKLPPPTETFTQIRGQNAYSMPPPPPPGGHLQHPQLQSQQQQQRVGGSVGGGPGGLNFFANNPLARVINGAPAPSAPPVPMPSFAQPLPGLQHVNLPNAVVCLQHVNEFHETPNGHVRDIREPHPLPPLPARTAQQQIEDDAFLARQLSQQGEGGARKHTEQELADEKLARQLHAELSVNFHAQLAASSGLPVVGGGAAVSSSNRGGTGVAAVSSGARPRDAAEHVKGTTDDERLAWEIHMSEVNATLASQRGQAPKPGKQESEDARMARELQETFNKIDAAAGRPGMMNM